MQQAKPFLRKQGLELELQGSSKGRLKRSLLRL
jgi:hypothetical protein